MTNRSNSWRHLSLSLAFLLAGTLIPAQAQKQSRRAAKSAEQSASANKAITGPADGEVRLKLSDGTRVKVEDAWESNQGIWYVQGGITHLVPRVRVKAIERGPKSDLKSKTEPQTAGIPEGAPTQETSTEQPAWIYLVGGARVEADSATESIAGVWYRRGPLSIFIERSRIERIEREHLESLVADSSLKKERGWSTGRLKIDALIRQNGAKYGVDPYLIFCVMEQESHFNVHALSPKGARGLMQLMPGTGARFGVRRPFDPAQNVAGGTRYLKQLMGQFNGRVDLVLASYNAGEGAVVRFGHKVPPYRETRDYVKRISYRYRQTKSTTNPPQRNGVGAGGM